MKTLILGGTTEASRLAQALADKNITAIFSYAGRVAQPKPQPLPIRTGGFGGVDGLVDFIHQNHISHIIDATHPFAQQMSSNACAASEKTGIKLLAFTRPAWQPTQGEQWTSVSDIAAAAKLLGSLQSKRVMLAIGRLHLNQFKQHKQHFYLLRMVDQTQQALPFDKYEVIVDRGPFNLDSERELLGNKRIDLIVSKNGGGKGAEAKLIAARELGIPIIMIERPDIPARPETDSLEAVMHWLTT